MNEIEDLRELKYRTVGVDRTLSDKLHHYRYYLREMGLAKTLKKTFIKARFGDRIPYSFYRKEVAASRRELSRQRRDGLPGGPSFCVVVFGDGNDMPDLTKQTYSDYHTVRLLDGQSADISPSEWVLFLKNTDELEPDALYCLAVAVAKNPGADIVYSDEDINYRVPLFKGDFNKTLICCKNYMGNIMAVSGAILPDKKVRSSDTGSYDFVLRCVDEARSVVHIPRVLYHRIDPLLTTTKRKKPGPEDIVSDITKDYSEIAEKIKHDPEADIKAIAGHMKRNGLKGKPCATSYSGIYDIEPELQSHPMVSFMIPNYEQREVLKACIDSLINKLTYDNYEIIVVENNSKSDEIFEYYKVIEKDPRIRVIYYDSGFNFSAINNLAAREARGEYLVLLNNDTEVITPDLIERMLWFFSQPDVGAVGPKLYYPDGTLQHIGVVLGLGGIAGHFAAREPGDGRAYFDRAVASADVSAVTAACMMVKKSVYEKLGGLNEELQVAYNDMDFCVRIGQAGYRLIYCAGAEMTHYESISRGFEDRPDKLARYATEFNYMRRTWGDVLKNDPYYSPNLSDKLSNCNLKDLPEA